MELHQLRYFLAVARTGSFTRAAEACHVSQPSLSAQLAKLEDELGGPLFDRLRTGARLTARGELLRPRAAEALQQLEEARGELGALDGLERGEVTLGCMPTTGAFLLPPLLKAFRQEHPRVTVHLLEESSPTLGLALREGRVDLALMDEAGLGPGLAAEVVLQEPLVLALPADHAFVGRDEVALEELAGQPLVLLKSGHGFRTIVLAALAAAGVEPVVVYESGGIDTVQALVEAGLGLSLVPRMMQKHPGPVYRRIAAPTPTRTLLLARREAGSLGAAAAALRRVAATIWS